MEEAENISGEVRRLRWNLINQVLRKGPTHYRAVTLGWTPEWEKGRGDDQKQHSGGWWRLSETMQACRLVDFWGFLFGHLLQRRYNAF